ncbi:hypothetical protein CFOL_v3_12117 [Cephalotus follicularis]|uniref:Nucleolus and neural progenitor protein-like N-terminal domain-containing protein n=1 Tax=Cephalotus follicularis TaxID=3775 RepID=A0A1Q3BL72_CEPFO|nr:hypothetical protein CFOL_v3_12117 [Cephalotus follicularis]
MDSETETLAERLNSFLLQLEVEHGIFERIVYKNKKQHRRCSYFQRLLKVRRDMRLLQSAKLKEVLASCFQVITGKKPKQKIHLLQSLKRRKCDGGYFNFMERLLGATRLLSRMVEPMLKAAIEVSTLLARSFFMGFSVTILALLARLRVLVQQILLDAVSVFNLVSSLSQRKQSVKIKQEGIEVFREFYPTNEDFITLECEWKTDKFVLLEKNLKSEIPSQEGDIGGDVSIGDSAVQYWSIETFLEDDEHGPKKAGADYAVEEESNFVKDDKTDLLVNPSAESDKGKQVEVCVRITNETKNAGTPGINLPPEAHLRETSSTSPSSTPAIHKSGEKKVAFISVKKPAIVPSKATLTDLHLKGTENKSSDKEDPFYKLLSGGGSLKKSLF